MIIWNENGLWCAYFNFCMGYGPTMLEAMRYCFELIQEKSPGPMHESGQGSIVSGSGATIKERE